MLNLNYLQLQQKKTLIVLISHQKIIVQCRFIKFNLSLNKMEIIVKSKILIITTKIIKIATKRINHFKWKITIILI